MKFINLRLFFQNQEILDVRNIMNVFGPFDRRRLFEWQQKGYIKKLSNNFYVFSDAALDGNSLKSIANKLYHPSYIGLESALSFYKLIPEAVYQITSITTRKTKALKTDTAHFKYRNIKKSLFWGYTLKQINNQSFYISDPEKTILDYFYLNPNQSSLEAIQEMRFNKTTGRELLDFDTLSKNARLFSNKRLDTALHYFKKVIHA